MAQVKFRLDKETWKKIGKGALIALGGTAGTVILEYATKVNFGAWTPLVVSGISIVINACREYVKGEKKDAG